MINTKTHKAVNLFKQGLIKESLAIFKTFRIGFTREEKRTLEIASDCLNGRSSFYQQIGIDTETIIRQSLSIINSKYLSYGKDV